MRPMILTVPASQLFCGVTEMKTRTAVDSVRAILDPCLKTVPRTCSNKSILEQGAHRFRRKSFSYCCQGLDASVKGMVFYMSASNVEQDFPQEDQAASQRIFTEKVEQERQERYGHIYQPARRRPFNLEARMRMKAYRREAIKQRRAAELEEEARNIDLDPAKLLQKGDPNTLQGVIKDVIPVGYFVTLPNGREGWLPASELGCTGGVVLLERLFKVGQEITVRIIPSQGARSKLTVKQEISITEVTSDTIGSNQ